MPGEEIQETGRDGVRRAKEWLERTGRADVYWTAYEQPSMLVVKRPGGGERSFDMGGTLHGGEFKASPFYAEVKKYSTVGGQADMYGDYIANCYCMLLAEPDKPFEFMWITWHPFSQSKWAKLCEWDEVRDEVEARKTDWLGTAAVVDEQLCRDVAERLWLIVLSDQQERLGMSVEMLAEIRKAATMGTKR